MKLKSIFAVILLFLSFNVVFAQELARTLYDQGKFSEALESIKQRGFNTASDYYNAGNCYFRLGKPGQALSYFEKAAQLSPSNNDIRYNIRIAEEAIARTAALPRDQSFWGGQFVPVARRLPEIVVDLIFAVATCVLGFSIHRLGRRKLPVKQALQQPQFLGMLSVWLIVAGLTGATVMAHRTKLAAIVADVSVARSGPSDTFTELFKLPAGAKVELTGEGREGWRQVRFSLGNVGWMLDKDLLPL